jgi:hypothetical protein
VKVWQWIGKDMAAGWFKGIRGQCVCGKYNNAVIWDDSTSFVEERLLCILHFIYHVLVDYHNLTSITLSLTNISLTYCSAWLAQQCL